MNPGLYPAELYYWNEPHVCWRAGGRVGIAHVKHLSTHTHRQTKQTVDKGEGENDTKGRGERRWQSRNPDTVLKFTVII